MHFYCRFVFVFLFFACAHFSYAKPSLDDYANLPDVSYASLSPDGQYFALARPYKGKQAAFIYNLNDPNGDPKIIPNPGDEIDMGGFSWHGPKHLVFAISRSVKEGRERYEIRRLASYNVATGKFATLMSRGAREIESSNPSMTWVVNRLPNEPNHILMGAYGYDGRSSGLKKSQSMGQKDNSGFRIKTFKVDLTTGKAKAQQTATQNTVDVITTKDGKFAARMDYDEERKVYSVYGRTTGKWKQIYKKHTTKRNFSLQGLGQTANTVVISRYGQSGYRELVEMSLLDGKIGKTLFKSSKFDFGNVLFDPNARKIVGVVVEKDIEKYVFFDKDLKQWQAELAAEFPGKNTALIQWNAKRTRFMIYVSGGGSTGEYYLFDTSDMSLAKLGTRYANIGKADIASVIPYDIMASDGLKIPGYLTLPLGKTKSQGPFPTVVMPHGGPESRDNAEFDYWAQYFASKGYAVYQPNFRGSSGYGGDFRDAGYGEFGGKMIDDVVDGTKALVANRTAKSGKICIMGASYGGYAALTASVKAPNLYACTVSVNGVTNVGEFFQWASSYSGKESQTANYWRRYIGHDNLMALPGPQKKTSIWSPSRQVTKLKAPVLLMHGDEDTNVDYEQFKFMKSALKKSGGAYEAVTMKGNDHYLRTSAARKEVLNRSGVFIDRYIGH